jgi:hypothetical protein
VKELLLASCSATMTASEVMVVDGVLLLDGKRFATERAGCG